jgi:ribonuclease D
LSPAQLAYAAADVEHLPALLAHLRRELEEKDRWRWALEDSARLVSAARRENNPEEAYLRFRSLARLSPAQRAALQRLAAWREGEARARDLPRRTVLSDELLQDLSNKRPRDWAGLKALRSYDARAAQRDGETWLELLRTAPERPEPAVAVEPLNPEQEARLAHLREAVEVRARELGLAPEVLLTRRGMEAIARQADPTDVAATGWRGEVLAGL